MHAIEAGATYAVLSGFTALRDTIDNAGVMTVATNTEFVIDGIVTLAGGRLSLAHRAAVSTSAPRLLCKPPVNPLTRAP